MRSRHRGGASPEAPRSPSARSTALDVLARIEQDGAYANLALGSALDRSSLSGPDRRFATDLVYGTTRMRRAIDAAIDRFIDVDPDAVTRRVLRLGAYQLIYAKVPAHAAVAETVSLAPRRTRGFVNAVLRRVAENPTATFPSAAARLSYPDWIVDRVIADAGEDDGLASLERMNAAPSATMRDDGYVQDIASQWVAAAVEPRQGEFVLDMCAAPGGKATALAGSGAVVIAGDRSHRRVGLIADNAARLGYPLSALVADGTRSPFGSDAFDAVLVDAPCSGLGALRRRPDARWRMRSTDVDDLASLQADLLSEAARVVRPGGRLVYSVCTITAQESIDHLTPDGLVVDERPLPVGTWRRFGHGWRVLPHESDSDGMVVIRYRREP